MALLMSIAADEQLDCVPSYWFVIIQRDRCSQVVTEAYWTGSKMLGC